LKKSQNAAVPKSVLRSFGSICLSGRPVSLKLQSEGQWLCQNKLSGYQAFSIPGRSWCTELAFVSFLYSLPGDILCIGGGSPEKQPKGYVYIERFILRN
jgi:hypothetical protein